MSQTTRGILFGLAAFSAWGFLPAYWKQLQVVPPLEILSHRVVWSFLFLGIILSLQNRWKEVGQTLDSRQSAIRLGLCGILIGFNWLIYIWAVNSGKVVETSLGYYINPMVNVLLGYLLLKERFSRLQWIAVFFAFCGVMYSLLVYGSLPWFALVLAISFALYGFSRKKTQAAPIPGLFIETAALVIPAAAFIIYQVASGQSIFGQDRIITLWCMGSGIVTSLPLVWFAGAAKRLNLSTIGILQYLAPSIAFCLGVFVYQEPFSHHNLVTFVCIWAGVFLYIWESAFRMKRSSPGPK